jgi:hypothetical protein
LTRERTPQGYGSLKFNEDYSARREKAYKSERNMEYNEYLDKVSTVSYHLMYKKGGGLFVSLHILRLNKVSTFSNHLMYKGEGAICVPSYLKT